MPSCRAPPLTRTLSRRERARALLLLGALLGGASPGGAEGDQLPCLPGPDGCDHGGGAEGSVSSDPVRTLVEAAAVGLSGVGQGRGLVGSASGLLPSLPGFLAVGVGSAHLGAEGEHALAMRDGGAHLGELFL